MSKVLVKDYFKEHLTESQYREFEKIDDCHVEKYVSQKNLTFNHVLQSSVIWAETPQGYSYWSGILKREPEPEPEMKPIEGYYYCVRDYSSHTARNTLIKVLSRRQLYRRDAENWLEHCAKTEEPKCRKDFFVLFRKEPWTDHHRKLMKEWNYDKIEYWSKS